MRIMMKNIRRHKKKLFLSFPFANVFSMADGPLGESSGTVSTIVVITIMFVIVIVIVIVLTILIVIIVIIFLLQIYMYTTPIEISFIDLAIDNRASITLSLAQVFIPILTIVTIVIILNRVSIVTTKASIPKTPLVATFASLAGETSLLSSSSSM